MVKRPEPIAHGVMDSAPENEMGVVCLFMDWARRNKVRIGSIQSQYPDCIAWQKAGGSEKRVRIEFEYKSRNFQAHKHDPAGCDWIVCWEHNWPECPKKIHVFELRKEYGLGFNVWVQPVSDKAPNHFSSRLGKLKKTEWSVAKQAHEGDLVLFYHSSPRKEIGDVFRLSSPVKTYEARGKSFGWNNRKSDSFANIERVAQLKSPVTLEHLKQDPLLKNSGWIRNQLVSRAKVTVDWIFLRTLILARNPGLEQKLPGPDGMAVDKR